MFVEGLIDKDHLRLMEVAGYEFDWKIEDEAQLEKAKQDGLPMPDEIDFSCECYVRFYVESDIEEYFPAKRVITYIEEKDLPLLLNIKHEKISRLVAEAIKRS